MGGYRTILGDAAQIDNAERPYVVAHIKQDGDVEVSSCVKDGGQLLRLAMGANEAFGMHCLGEEQSRDAYEMLRSAGFVDSEINQIIGLSALVTAALGMGSREYKKHLASALAKAIDVLVVQDKTLSEAAQAAQETRH